MFGKVFDGLLWIVANTVLFAWKALVFNTVASLIGFLECLPVLVLGGHGPLAMTTYTVTWSIAFMVLLLSAD